MELRKREEASGEDLAYLSEVQIKQETQKEGLALLTRGRSTVEVKQHGALSAEPASPKARPPWGLQS